jgi:hypothetical protein
MVSTSKNNKDIFWQGVVLFSGSIIFTILYQDPTPLFSTLSYLGFFDGGSSSSLAGDNVNNSPDSNSKLNETSNTINKPKTSSPVNSIEKSVETNEVKPNISESTPTSEKGENTPLQISNSDILSSIENQSCSLDTNLLLNEVQNVIEDTLFSVESKLAIEEVVDKLVTDVETQFTVSNVLDDAIYEIESTVVSENIIDDFVTNIDISSEVNTVLNTQIIRYLEFQQVHPDSKVTFDVFTGRQDMSNDELIWILDQIGIDKTPFLNNTTTVEEQTNAYLAIHNYLNPFPLPEFVKSDD